jgi:hypothetical protein
MVTSLIPKYSVQKRVRDSFILQYRDSFATDDVFKWTNDPSTSKIFINDSVPMQAVLYPSIIITSLSGEETRYLGNDIFSDSDYTTDRFTSLDFVVNIEVMALSTPERDKVIDRVYELLKDFQDILADKGIAVKPVKFPNDSKKFVNDRYYYTAGITIPIYCEWSESIVYTDIVTGIGVTFTVGMTV